MTTNARRAGTLAALCPLVLLGGCLASGSPVWDAQFGDATRRLNAQQTANPDAAGRTTVQAMDGRAAREAHDRYLESFTVPPSNTVINIGIGGGGR